MRRLDLQANNSLVPERLAGRLLIAGTALVLVLIVAPFTVRPLVDAWVEPKQAPAVATEAWPAAPPAYAPPTVAPAMAARSLPTATPLPAPRWRELSYLTTVEFTASSVVEAQRTASVVWLGEMVTDRLLLKAVGKVQVGVDLSQIAGVQIAGNKISFTLPQPVVTSVELLPRQSQIFDKQQLIFLSQYEGLETEALEQARLQLRQEITDNPSMMKLAEEFARLQLTEFLRKAGFATVEVMFQEAADD